MGLFGCSHIWNFKGLYDTGQMGYECSRCGASEFRGEAREPIVPAGNHRLAVNQYTGEAFFLDADVHAGPAEALNYAISTLLEAVRPFPHLLRPVFALDRYDADNPEHEYEPFHWDIGRYSSLLPVRAVLVQAANTDLYYLVFEDGQMAFLWRFAEIVNPEYPTLIAELPAGEEFYCSVVDHTFTPVSAMFDPSFTPEMMEGMRLAVLTKVVQLAG